MAACSDASEGSDRKGRNPVQYPVKEIDGLRGRELLVEEGKIAVENGCFDLELCGQETEDCTVRIAEGLTFSGSGGCAPSS